MRAEVLLDTAYVIALSSPNDLFYHRAVQLADGVEDLNHVIDGLVAGQSVLYERMCQ